jgi:hypothetical protein
VLALLKQSKPAIVLFGVVDLVGAMCTLATLVIPDPA